MKFDDLMALAKKPEGPECGDDILNMVQLMLTADDLSVSEKGGYAAGFLTGTAYVLAKHNQGKILDAARALVRLHQEWEAHGIL